MVLHDIVVWMAHTMTIREIFSQPKQTTKYRTPKYNIPSNINKQANNYIMQNSAKQRYIFGHLSLIRSLALDIPSEVATVRDLKEKRPSKKRFRYLLGHLSFWVSGMELPLIFSYKKKYITELFSSLIE